MNAHSTRNPPAPSVDDQRRFIEWLLRYERELQPDQ